MIYTKMIYTNHISTILVPSSSCSPECGLLEVGGGDKSKSDKYISNYVYQLYIDKDIPVVTDSF